MLDRHTDRGEHLSQPPGGPTGRLARLSSLHRRIGGCPTTPSPTAPDVHCRAVPTLSPFLFPTHSIAYFEIGVNDRPVAVDTIADTEARRTCPQERLRVRTVTHTVPIASPLCSCIHSSQREAVPNHPWESTTPAPPHAFPSTGVCDVRCISLLMTHPTRGFPPFPTRSACSQRRQPRHRSLTTKPDNQVHQAKWYVSCCVPRCFCVPNG